MEVATGATAEEGLRQLAETQPDAVLLDVLLPQVSGLDVFDGSASAMPSCR